LFLFAVLAALLKDGKGSEMSAGKDFFPVFNLLSNSFQ
jgi:hypothetical protein